MVYQTTQNPFADMMKNLSGSMPSMPQMPSMPSLDMTQIMNVGRRNAEACTAAGQALTESCQAISRRQAELARAQVEKTLKSCKDMLVNGSPEINTTKQVELAKSMFESNFNNLREIYETVMKTNLETFDKMNRRASESIEELTATATSTTSKKKSAA